MFKQEVGRFTAAWRDVAGSARDAPSTGWPKKSCSLLAKECKDWCPPAPTSRLISAIRLQNRSPFPRGGHQQTWWDPPVLPSLPWTPSVALLRSLGVLVWLGGAQATPQALPRVTSPWGREALKRLQTTVGRGFLPSLMSSTHLWGAQPSQSGRPWLCWGRQQHPGCEEQDQRRQTVLCMRCCDSFSNQNIWA